MVRIAPNGRHVIIESVINYFVFIAFKIIVPVSVRGVIFFFFFHFLSSWVAGVVIAERKVSTEVIVQDRRDRQVTGTGLQRDRSRVWGSGQREWFSVL